MPAPSQPLLWGNSACSKNQRPTEHSAISTSFSHQNRFGSLVIPSQSLPPRCNRGSGGRRCGGWLIHVSRPGQQEKVVSSVTPDIPFHCLVHRSRHSRRAPDQKERDRC